MKTPFEILDVSTLADDTQIKQAYLQKVKQYPPDHYHEQFQQIHTAYQTIKDEKSRLSYELFHYAEADFDALLDAGLVSQTPPVFTYDSFDKFLKASITDQLFNVSTHH
jgi:curved DNA-binding protein CbpA